MVNTVVGSGPIGFTDVNGNQRFIPLSSLFFENGIIQAKNWPLYTANQAIVDAVLNALNADGLLVPGPTPPIKPAMVLESAIAGVKGNSIQVVFSNLVVDATTPANTTFDATISARSSYPGLSFDSAAPSFIKTVLGTETIVGTSPGLIHAKDGDTPKQPKPSSYALTGGGTSAKSSVAVVGATDPTAFTVEAWKNGAGGDNISVTVSAVDATAKTFTLLVEWKEQKLTGIKLADVSTQLAGDGLLLKVSPPVGGSFALPAIGTILLTGGRDAQAASPASATVVAQS